MSSPEDDISGNEDLSSNEELPGTASQLMRNRTGLSGRTGRLIMVAAATLAVVFAVSMLLPATVPSDNHPPSPSNPTAPTGPASSASPTPTSDSPGVPAGSGVRQQLVDADGPHLVLTVDGAATDLPPLATTCDQTQCHTAVQWPAANSVASSESGSSILMTLPDDHTPTAAVRTSLADPADSFTATPRQAEGGYLLTIPPDTWRFTVISDQGTTWQFDITGT